MKLLSHAYRFLSNFVFLALVYYSLNFMEKYNQRATIAILVLVYAGMRAASACVRSISISGSKGSNWKRGVSWGFSATDLPCPRRGSRSSPMWARCAIPGR